MWTRITKLQKFFFLLIVLSLLFAIVGKYLCERYLNMGDPVINSVLSLKIIGALYMFAPAISVLIVEKWKFRKIFTNYRIRLKNINIAQSLKYLTATAFLLPALILFFSYLTGNILGLKDFGMLIISNEDFDPQILSKLPSPFLNLSFRLLIGFPLIAIYSLFVGCTVNLFFAMGEEIAWRGFLEKEILIKGYRKALVIGIIWGLWHAPLILMGLNYGAHRIAGILFMVIVCVALAFYFSQALHRSGSLLIPAAMHGIINTTIILIFVKTGNPLLGPPLGLTFALSVATVIFVFWLFRKRTVNEEK
ncbi:MAG: CPBP family intramembrane metalloprotease [Dysgonamonadaceae bacterium]|jgi:membrane protease YdiL (CAAX protease family)|nr:CPBP family intramembrane metalloprotease [Dysgonamonadaceae bacterium]